MQFFYVKSNVTLQLPHKRHILEAPSPENLAAQQIPIKNLHCGNIAWEVIHAKETVGEQDAVIQPMTAEIQRLLPPAIVAWTEGNDLITQLQNIIRHRPPEKRHEPIKLALINGVGTMLGDTLVGSTAVEIAARQLTAAIGPIEIHAYAAWNCRPGVENILARSPAISYVQGSSISLDKLCSYDAYWDFSALLRMEGYNTLPLIDFYLKNLGIDPNSIDAAEKLPALRLLNAVVTEAKSLLTEKSKGRKIVLIQGQASTPIRSMPDAFLARLINDVLTQTDACVLLTQPLPEGLSDTQHERLIHFENWCKPSVDHYLASVAMANAIISVDSLAIHAASAVRMPGIVIFTTLPPELRLTYAPQLTGMLIPDARNLSTWGKHKHDDNWPNQQLEYNQAWAKIDTGAIIGKLLTT
ncbi:MAG: glycosyltransferase family 9 protein [Methylobacter sp.]